MTQRMVATLELAIFIVVQGNMRCSLTSQLTLIGDIADKTKYPSGIDILFLMEPLPVTKTNTIQGIPDDIFYLLCRKIGLCSPCNHKFYFLEMSSILYKRHKCLPGKT